MSTGRRFDRALRLLLVALFAQLVAGCASGPQSSQAIKWIQEDAAVASRGVVYESCSRKAGICAQLITAESLAG